MMEDKVQFIGYCKVIKLNQKRACWQQCLKESVLLRSNQKESIDYDLSIINANLTFSKHAAPLIQSEIDTFVKQNKINWTAINKKQKL